MAETLEARCLVWCYLFLPMEVLLPQTSEPASFDTAFENDALRRFISVILMNLLLETPQDFGSV